MENIFWILWKSFALLKIFHFHPHPSIFQLSVFCSNPKTIELVQKKLFFIIIFFLWRIAVFNFSVGIKNCIKETNISLLLQGSQEYHVDLDHQVLLFSLAGQGFLENQVGQGGQWSPFWVLHPEGIYCNPLLHLRTCIGKRRKNTLSQQIHFQLYPLYIHILENTWAVYQILEKSAYFFLIRH